MFLEQLSAVTRVRHHRPWPRAMVDIEGWRLAGTRLADGAWTLVSLWGEQGAVHAAIRDHASGEAGVLSLECPDGRFPSLAQFHAPALRLERTIQDLFGLTAENLPDPRPWLDHGRWGVSHPIGNAGAGGSQALHIPAGRGRKPDPDRRRPRSCRYHRTGLLPLHGQWGNRRPPRRTAGLYAQGHRKADAGRRRFRAGSSLQAVPAATARSPMAMLLRGRPKLRLGSRCRRAPSGSGR